MGRPTSAGAAHPKRIRSHQRGDASSPLRKHRFSSSVQHLCSASRSASFDSDGNVVQKRESSQRSPSLTSHGGVAQKRESSQRLNVRDKSFTGCRQTTSSNLYESALEMTFPYNLPPLSLEQIDPSRQ